MISDAELLAGLTFLQKHADPIYSDALKVAEKVILSIQQRHALTERMSRSIDELTLSVRVRSRLAELGVTTIGALCNLRSEDLCQYRKFGALNLREVRKEIGRLGLALRGEDPER